MRPGIISSSRLHRLRLAAAGAVLVSIPALCSLSACGFEKDKCDVPCVEVCGGPVVELACDACPEGLIDPTGLICVPNCGFFDEPNSASFSVNACGQCPDGLFDIQECWS